MLKKGQNNILVATDLNHKLSDVFYHHFIPNTVVIDQDGVVEAFCSPAEIDQFVISKLLNCESVSFTMKHEY